MVEIELLHWKSRKLPMIPNVPLQKEKLHSRKQTKHFLLKIPVRHVEITSEDDIHCSGIYYPNGNSHDWVIALHGYRGDHLGATSLAQHYHDHNYQVLTPDLRACGDTDGNYLGMGWLDRKDILSWIDWIIAQDSDAKSLFTVFPWVLPQP